MEFNMAPELKFRICLSDYLRYELGYRLTKEQRDYVFERAWHFYGGMGFSFDEVREFRPRNSLDAELRVYAHNAKKESAA